LVVERTDPKGFKNPSGLRLVHYTRRDHIPARVEPVKENRVVNLPKVSAPAAAAGTVVDRIRERLSATPVQAEATKPPVRVTLSASVSAIEAGDASIEDALRRADELLYRAKQGGRNRVEA
jgi:diguanylate cyclase (GGDEF)-like protein